MRVAFTKMQGAGNDFVVLDETSQRLNLRSAHYRFLGDRHFGVGADQILSVRPSPGAGIDFEYVIHNADGAEVEHCGNGARCFLKFVSDRGLVPPGPVRVKTMNRVLELRWQDGARVEVDMGVPEFDPARVPFDPEGLLAQPAGTWQRWSLPVDSLNGAATAAVLSMGNPHAVLLVEDSKRADVARLGPAVQGLKAFPQGVNVGFMQVLQPDRIRLRVHERGAGETLACGTGACAAVVAGIRLGLLQGPVDVLTLGGILRVSWNGVDGPVLMSGPAGTVFEGVIDIPDNL